MGSSFVLLQLDSFAELHAGNDKAELQPKSPMTIHAIHGSIYDYVKESENREIACIVGKMMEMTLNKLSATIYGRLI